MIDGNCSKDYPKSFSNVTVICDDSYPSYRRRSPLDGGYASSILFGGKTIVIDNRNVVPYNAWLLLKYKSHMNVEYCASIKAVKYLYEYIYKGSNQATVTFENGERQEEQRCNDEIKLYEQCCYVGASEAV